MANRALLVGINEYRNAPLRGCVNDVADVSDLLKSRCNFQASEVRVLLDDEATTVNIKSQLQDWLIGDAAPQDRLLFHFSGHGTQLPGRDGTVHDVVCPFDFDFTEAHALSDVDFSAIFKLLPAGAQFVWISDSCHSGDLARAAPKREVRARYLPPPPLIMAQINALLARGAGRRSLNGVVERLKGVLIAGCRSDETSADAIFSGRYSGALSYYLVKALLREDGLNLGVERIIEGVQRALSDNGYQQHPQLRGLSDLRQKPFLTFVSDASQRTFGTALNLPVPTYAETSRGGDGQFWGDDFESDIGQGALARGDTGWSKVHWATNDEDSPDYRHVASSPLKGLPFAFTSDDLELLIRANAFEPLRDRGKIIFALRGAELMAMDNAGADDNFHQVGRTALHLRETRPDHQHFRCVIGVYDIAQRKLSGFIASTVPCRQAVYSYANDGDPSNMLPTGCYRLAVGTHKGRIGCLMEDDDFAVLRTRNDYVYDTKDVWDDAFPGDDLHPAFANSSAQFSSWGCQTIRGDCPKGTDHFTGEYKDFRQALGLRAGTADHGVKFSYVILTGLEAATASKLSTGGLELLARLRQGSRGEHVRALQQKLGVTVNGTFDSKLAKALTDQQKRKLGWADGIYGAEMDKLLGLNIFTQAPVAVTLNAPPLAAVGTTAGASSALRDADARNVDAGVTLDGFVLRLRRLRTELREDQGFARTVSCYESFFDRQKIPGLEGMAYERQGPGDNGASGRKYHRRIAAGTYPLFTQDGTNYQTIGYETSGAHPRPGVLVGGTGERVAILFHPGNLYLSSVGCINLSKPLSNAREDMVYSESQTRVIAMINAMKEKLGGRFPAHNGEPISNAWLVIEGEPPNAETGTYAVAVRSMLSRDAGRGRMGLDALSGHEAYALLGATMNGTALGQRVDAPLFTELSQQVSDIQRVRGEFGCNLWSEWASGWQASTAIADGGERERVQRELNRIADRLSQIGVDINDTVGDYTPLIDSARGNEWEAMRALHARGADLNLRDKFGDTPLTAAAFNGSQEAVAFLIVAGADRQAAVSKPRLARSGASDTLFETCPIGSNARECAKIGRALHRGNDVRLTAYDRIMGALDQVKIGRVCHIWDYASHACKQSIDVWQLSGSQSAHFLSKLEVDADGAPRAYHPKDRNPPDNEGKAFDWLANLGSSDRHGIQGENGAVGPAPGFVISATSLTDERYPFNDTRRYVDASSIPYVVLPKGVFPLPAETTLKLGCLVYVVDTKTGGTSGAIFADIGRAVGEGSIRLAQRLGLVPFSSSRYPKVVGFSGGAKDRRFFYLVFPETVITAPWPIEEIQAQATALFEAWGGADRLKVVVPGLPTLKPPVTVFNGVEPPSSRDVDPDEDAKARLRLRGLDMSKERALDEAPRRGLPNTLSPGVDRAPLPGKFAPEPQELRRLAPQVHPDEMDGPGDLPPQTETRAALPKVTWPSSDGDSPCYAHLVPEEGDPQIGTSTFEFTAADLKLLIATNVFKPEGYGDRIVFALRGAKLQQKDSFESVDRIPLAESRPDHRNFCCVIGIFNMRTGKLSAFKASTVPNIDYMTNYYRKVHNLPPFSSTNANILPTGCYVFRIGTHQGNIYPALRLTDPENLDEDGKAVVLRTTNDLTYKCDDLWDPCVPYDHVHCAYSYDSFSSAGCLTVCGPSTEGPWARFQNVLRTIPRNNRIDLVLLTGREASIAAGLRNGGHASDAAIVEKLLTRLRAGSQGDPVRKLQEHLGVAASGYFGWRTKEALVEQQRRANLPRDGIYTPKLDRLLGWDVLRAGGAAPTPVVASRASFPRFGGPVRVTIEDIHRFAPHALNEYLRILANEGQSELSALQIIDNPMRFCHFMAQIGHECGGFTIKCESLNYTTVARLRAVWPSRFPDDASARPYLRNEEKLAEKVYGGRLGNTEKGDGFRYRGRGFVQITGRESYRELGRKLQLPLEENPDLALDPIVALRIACRTWADKTLDGERGMNELADRNKIEALTYRINGGYTNLVDRRAEFEKAWDIWGEGEPPAGISDAETIERGDRGELVVKLKQNLQELGYYAGDTDRIFGSKTYLAVYKFQKEHGLRPSGVMTPETWAAINRALLRRRSPPPRGPQQREAHAGQRNLPRPREIAMMRGIRFIAVALASIASVFGLAFLMSLARPQHFGFVSMWLPLVFAAVVFMGAFLIGQWGAAVASSAPYEYARSRRNPTQPAVLADTVAEDPEPVRVGALLPVED